MSKKKITFAKPNFKDSSDRQLKEYFTEKLKEGYYDELKAELKELKNLRPSKESAKILQNAFIRSSALMDSEALNVFLDVLGTKVVKYIASMKDRRVEDPALYDFFMCSFFNKKHNSEKFIKCLKIFLNIYGLDIVNILENEKDGMVRYITKTKEINDDFKIALKQAQEEGKLAITNEDYLKIIQLITLDSPETEETTSQESSNESSVLEENQSQDQSEDSTENQQSDSSGMVIEKTEKPITTHSNNNSSNQNESVTKILQSIFGNLETLPLSVKNLIKHSEIYKTLAKFLESNNQLLRMFDNQTKHQPSEEPEFIDQEDFASINLEPDLFSMLPDISTTLDTNLIGFIPTQMVSF